MFSYYFFRPNNFIFSLGLVLISNGLGVIEDAVRIVDLKLEWRTNNL
jgi:hypothetical protein